MKNSFISDIKRNIKIIGAGVLTSKATVILLTIMLTVGVICEVFGMLHANAYCMTISYLLMNTVFVSAVYIQSRSKLTAVSVSQKNFYNWIVPMTVTSGMPLYIAVNIAAVLISVLTGRNTDSFIECAGIQMLVIPAFYIIHSCLNLIWFTGKKGSNTGVHTGIAYGALPVIFKDILEAFLEKKDFAELVSYPVALVINIVSAVAIFAILKGVCTLIYKKDKYAHNVPENQDAVMIQAALENKH